MTDEQYRLCEIEEGILERDFVWGCGFFRRNPQLLAGLLPDTGPTAEQIAKAKRLVFKLKLAGND